MGFMKNPSAALCPPTGYRRRESQDEEPRAVLAQRIEKETVGAQLPRTLFYPCLLPVGKEPGSFCC